jgi:hypothetical protein
MHRVAYVLVLELTVSRLPQYFIQYKRLQEYFLWFKKHATLEEYGTPHTHWIAE